MKYIFLCLFVLWASCCIKDDRTLNSLTIMSWNVQNLFDGVDNGQEYDDYSVKDGLWSDKLYKLRLRNIVKIIELNSPDIIGFQEIEGTVVLQDIINMIPEYKYHVSTEEPGAIQLGILSRYPIIKTGLITPYSDRSRLRSLQEISFDINGLELIIINNHWKSKRGAFSEDLRLKSSLALKKRLLELSDKEVVVLGDLNENYNEYQKVYKSFDTALMYRARGSGLTITEGHIESDELYTVWPGSVVAGSYKYKGEWESIDHFLLNKKLMDKDNFYFSEFFVDNRDLLLNNKGDVKKWNKDFKNGYSDHLPIILKLNRDGIQTTLE